VKSVGTCFSSATATESTARSVYVSTIIERSVPVASTLRCKVEKIIDRSQQIQAAFLDVGGHLRMGAVEVSQSVVRIASEHRYRRILISRVVFATQIVFECAVLATTQESQIIPASPARVRSQSRRIDGSHDGQIGFCAT
jgi:hypothetical protein